MNKSYKTPLMLLLTAGMMIVLAGYVTSVQKWLVFNYQQDSRNSGFSGASNVTSGGIRQIFGSNINHSDATDIPASDLRYEEPPKIKISPFQLSNQQQPLVTTSAEVEFSENDLKANNLSSEEFPLIAELEDELIIEFSDHYSKLEMQRALSRLLVMPESYTPQALFAKAAITTQKTPYLYPRVENQFGKTVRYPAQAYRYAEYLLHYSSQQLEENNRLYTVVTVPLKQFVLPKGVKTYQGLVEQFSDRYQVDKELVYAIMEVESAFNPSAVSKSNALGLMQIKAGSAGRDVYQHIDGRNGQPSQTTLFNPEENIRIGVAYLSLLKQLYFKDIRSQAKKELLAIASYNGGLNTVLKLFGKTPKQAVSRINRLSEQRILWMLKQRHHSAETRQYVEKVINKRKKYQKLLKLAA